MDTANNTENNTDNNTAANLLLAYYGDDFTGSTDVMDALVTNGVPTVLFFEPPDPAIIREKFPHVRAVGVAGVTRSMTPAQMEQVLAPAFSAIKALGAPLVHYKVCSTFDSSPTIGSIGRAIDIGQQVYSAYNADNAAFVPLIVGAPALRRYVAFGNLFATVGDETFRIDRHPTMSKHPITPMNEADLRLHLGKQTDRRIGAIDLLHLNGDPAGLNTALDDLIAGGAEIVLFDTLDNAHLTTIGRLIWERQHPLFIVGSSGVEYALTLHWKNAGIVQKPPPLPPLKPVDQLIVMAGSASPVTAKQIEWALEHGFEGIRLDTARLIDPANVDQERGSVIETALNALSSGKSVLIYSAIGPDDPAIAETSAALARIGRDPKSIGAVLGTQQGIIVRELLQKTGLRRACIAGGDTSGHAASQLGIYALEFAVPIVPGAPLCYARSHSPELDGLEICLKGGQNGKPDFFGLIRQGHG
jgi:3-oxoisoapionate kinase